MPSTKIDRKNLRMLQKKKRILSCLDSFSNSFENISYAQRRKVYYNKKTMKLLNFIGEFSNRVAIFKIVDNIKTVNETISKLPRKWNTSASGFNRTM